MTSLLKGFIPSALRIKKRPAFKPVSCTCDREWNSILYDTAKRLVELLLKRSKKAFLVVETEMQVEIERSDSASEISQDPEKNIRNIRNNLKKDGRRSGVRLDSGKPIPQVTKSMILDVKKEEIVLKNKLI